MNERVLEQLAKQLVTDGSDRIAWLKARSQGVTATDAAQLATEAAVLRVAQNKITGGTSFSSSFTAYGREREPVIAAWVQLHFGINPSSSLFHAPAEQKHLATPDGLSVEADGKVQLAEIKTTNKAWRTPPKNYLRQIWWQQYVLGAERTLLVWEEHRDFVPVSDTPNYKWIDRDDHEIQALVSRANQVLKHIAAAF